MSVRDQKLLLDALALETLEPRAREAFERMLEKLESGERRELSRKQREWIANELDIPSYENLVSSGTVPRGREVETPAVLKNRPLRPPGGRA